MSAMSAEDGFAMRVQATNPARNCHETACYTPHPRFRDGGREELTRLLAEWSAGNQAALSTSWRRLSTISCTASPRIPCGERPGHPLQTTALVNEAYLRLRERRRVSCQTRAEFFAVAAQMMRRVLVDYARGRQLHTSRRRLRVRGDDSRQSIELLRK